MQSISRFARTISLAVLLAASLLMCRHAAAQSYTVTLLGDLGGNFTIALGMNNVGQVVGYSFITPIGTSPGIYHAFLWQSGITTDLGTPGGTLSRACGINDAGQVVGMAEFVAGSNLSLGFLWDNGIWTSIPTFGGAQSNATAINSAGQIVGSASFPSGKGDGFLWQNGTMTDLGSLGSGGSYAYGINKGGQIVGWSGITIKSTGYVEACLWNDSIITDLGNLGGNISIATSINDSGQVVGYANTTNGSGTNHAFLWQNGIMTDLTPVQGVTGSIANAINNAGQIVGYATPPGGTPLATIWQNGIATDLNTLIPAGLGWPLTEALSINNSGQIVAVGEITNSVRSFLLTPYPTANPQAVSPDLGRPTAVALTGVDHDTPPLSLKFAIASQPSNGKLTGLNTSTGAVTYTPNNGFNGTDKFTFTVSNGTVTSTAATVILKVAVGTPTANSQTDTVVHNTATKITLTGTDPDDPPLQLTFAIKASPAHGTLGALNTSTGVVTYTPSANFGSGDTFTFTVSNGTKTSAPATVTLKVMPGTPTANSQAVTVAHNTTTAISLTGKDPDNPALPLKFAISAQPASGTLGTLNTVRGVVSYKPNSNFSGKDSFTFTVRNGTNTSAAAKVTLTVAAGVPTANAQSVTVAHNTVTTITLTGKDSDNPALPLTFVLKTEPTHGKVSGLNTSTGVITYTPSNNFQGADSFTFAVNNGTNTSAPATITLTVAAGTPTANAQPVAGAHNTSKAITLTGKDSDNPVLPLKYAISTGPKHGTLGTLNTTTGAVTYTPGANFQGADSFTFTVNNGTNSSAPATVTLKVAPGVPTANAQTVNVTENTPIQITLTGTDPDNPALPLIFGIATGPKHGTLGTLNTATGTVTYMPAANFQGTDTIDFTVSNGTNKSAAVVTMKVIGGG